MFAPIIDVYRLSPETFADLGRPSIVSEPLFLLTCHTVSDLSKVDCYHWASAKGCSRLRLSFSFFEYNRPWLSMGSGEEWAQKVTYLD
jgi:hypothetical protein